MLKKNTTPEDMLKKVTVLYVEDDADALEHLSTILEKKVKEIHTASNGEEGLAVFKENAKSIDLVLTDIRMPYMNGINMVKAIKDINKNIKVVYISAHNEADILLQAIDSGADGFVVKPISMVTKFRTTLNKIAVQIHNEKAVRDYNKILKKIIDTVDNIIIITNGVEIYQVNNRFFDYIEENRLEEFKANNSHFCDLFLYEEGFLHNRCVNTENWLEEANQHKNPKVKLKRLGTEDRVFSVRPTPIHIDDLNNIIYMVNFVDITDI
jgi:two-component system cell cycle response regulator